MKENNNLNEIIKNSFENKNNVENVYKLSLNN